MTENRRTLQPKYGFSRICRIRLPANRDRRDECDDVIYFIGADSYTLHDIRRRCDGDKNDNGQEICISKHIYVVHYHAYTASASKRISIPTRVFLSDGCVRNRCRLCFSSHRRDNCGLNYYYLNPLRRAPTQNPAAAVQCTRASIPYYAHVKGAREHT